MIFDAAMPNTICWSPVAVDAGGGGGGDGGGLEGGGGEAEKDMEAFEVDMLMNEGDSLKSGRGKRGLWEREKGDALNGNM